MDSRGKNLRVSGCHWLLLLLFAPYLIKQSIISALFWTSVKSRFMYHKACVFSSSVTSQYLSRNSITPSCPTRQASKKRLYFLKNLGITFFSMIYSTRPKSGNRIEGTVFVISFVVINEVHGRADIEICFIYISFQFTKLLWL